MTEIVLIHDFTSFISRWSLAMSIMCSVANAVKLKIQWRMRLVVSYKPILYCLALMK